MLQGQNFDSDLVFRSLVESGFEFLIKSLNEFEASPKFSTVHFAAALELFLKARLMKEHWSLLVERLDKANPDAFVQGQLKTITPNAVMERLNSICADPIPEAARKTFQEIAQHRNRMVHFVHGVAKPPELAQKEIDDVVAEQCKGWMHLHQLLVGGWAPHFVDFEVKIADVETMMQRHRGYLDAKFGSLAETIKKHLDAGQSVRSCHSCGYQALLVEPVSGAISAASCLVCWYTGSFVSVDCPGERCHQQIEFDSYVGPPTHCPSCGATIMEWISEGLDTGDPVTPDNYFDHTPINCPHCNGYHSVVEHHDGYVCTECFEYSEEVGTCGWCSEGQLGGVSEMSHYNGCAFCDGRAGWDRD
ncbi:hypothetical protein [Denitrobaculum tricleocarpae]|uniref:HsdR n=1 Tax=Denitrobaculum tricleocarpae TaxID=2591009 RepID=A0A545SZ59_9PROT|nr:hypothetical protein [Denitrobaculum tricleocarpae]TQV70255.1 hypothetical protein FKG95_28165 [Denitrobaculum tricleocarpae]